MELSAKIRRRKASGGTALRPLMAALSLRATLALSLRATLALSLSATLALSLLAPLALSQQAGESKAPVYILPYSGIIAPATVALVEKALNEAQQGGAQLLIIELDTPGGLDDSTRQISQLLIEAPLPVAVYVSPSGGRAASAGTYILYAAHIAAMARATSIGAATPVLMGAPQLPQPSPDADAGADAAAKPARSVLERKAENDAAAHIRGLAELRGRNADWAEAAVREAVSIPASEALEKGVIDYLAPTRAELLSAVDGREIALSAGQVRLDTAGAPQVVVERGLPLSVMLQLSSFELAGILLSLGGMLIMVEFYVGTGGIALVLGLMLGVFGALQLNLLPLEYYPFFLAAMLVALLVAVYMMGFAGAVLLVVLALASIGVQYLLYLGGGGWLSGVQLWGWLAFLAIAAGALMYWIIRPNLKPSISSAAYLQGTEVEALEDFDREGWVLFQGERWKGRWHGKVHKGERLYVRRIERLTIELTRDRLADASAGNASRRGGEKV